MAVRQFDMTESDENLFDPLEEEAEDYAEEPGFGGKDFAALQMLREDHDRVRQLFDDFEKTRDDSSRLAVAEEVFDELGLHTEIEEELFYPAVREALGDDVDTDGAEREHAEISNLIEELESMDAAEPAFTAKFNELIDHVNAHIHKEENELFERLREEGVDLREVAQAIAERKSDTFTG